MHELHHAFQWTMVKICVQEKMRSRVMSILRHHKSKIAALKQVLQGADSVSLSPQLRSSLLVLQQNFALANRTAAPQ